MGPVRTLFSYVKRKGTKYSENSCYLVIVKNKNYKPIPLNHITFAHERIIGLCPINPRLQVRIDSS